MFQDLCDRAKKDEIQLLAQTINSCRAKLRQLGDSKCVRSYYRIGVSCNSYRPPVDTMCFHDRIGYFSPIKGIPEEEGVLSSYSDITVLLIPAPEQNAYEERHSRVDKILEMLRKHLDHAVIVLTPIQYVAVCGEYILPLPYHV